MQGVSVGCDAFRVLRRAAVQPGIPERIALIILLVNGGLQCHVSCSAPDFGYSAGDIATVFLCGNAGLITRFCFIMLNTFAKMRR